MFIDSIKSYVRKGSNKFGFLSGTSLQSNVDLNMLGNGIEALKLPVGPLSAANKQYVDSIIVGASSDKLLGNVRVVSTSNLSLSGTPTIDGVTVEADDLVLAANQEDPIENGVYVVYAGEGESSWSRWDQLDVSTGGVVNNWVIVDEGTTYADTMWRITNIGTIDTDPMIWGRIAGDGDIKPGNILYVADNGSDTYGDGSATNPVKTIAKAIELIPADQAAKIIVGEGIFSSEDLDIDGVILEGSGLGTILTGDFGITGNLVKLMNLVIGGNLTTDTSDTISILYNVVFAGEWGFDIESGICNAYNVQAFGDSTVNVLSGASLLLYDSGINSTTTCISSEGRVAIFDSIIQCSDSTSAAIESFDGNISIFGGFVSNAAIDENINCIEIDNNAWDQLPNILCGVNVIGNIACNDSITYYEGLIQPRFFDTLSGTQLKRHEHQEIIDYIDTRLDNPTVLGKDRDASDETIVLQFGGFDAAQLEYTAERDYGLLKATATIPGSGDPTVTEIESTGTYEADCCAFSMDGIDYTSRAKESFGGDDCSLWGSQTSPKDVIRISTPVDPDHPEKQELPAGFDGSIEISAILIGGRTTGFPHTVLFPESSKEDVILYVYSIHNNEDAIDAYIENVFLVDIDGVYTYNGASLAGAKVLKGVKVGSTWTSWTEEGTPDPLPELWGTDGVGGYRSTTSVGSIILSSDALQTGVADGVSALADTVGTIRYTQSGTKSYCEMVMQTDGTPTYEWVVIHEEDWS